MFVFFQNRGGVLSESQRAQRTQRAQKEEVSTSGVGGVFAQTGKFVLLWGGVFAQTGKFVLQRADGMRCGVLLCRTSLCSLRPTVCVVFAQTGKFVLLWGGVFAQTGKFVLLCRRLL